jgi:hypothetical protein
MKKLLVALSAGALAVALFAIASPGATHRDARSGTSTTVKVALARAAFVKYMSSHAREISAKGATREAVSVKGAPTAFPSVNWSGYADTLTSASQSFTQVSGRWSIPRVSCLSGLYQNQDAFLSEWVGLDGFSDGTVEQLGTATQCFEGVEYYYVWYEMFPGGTVEEGTTACINNNVDCPRPGDRVAASVTVTPGGTGENDYTLALTDYSNPSESFSVAQTCAIATCGDSSAEWIVERPAFDLPFGFQILPQANYFETGFEQATQSTGGPSASIEKVAGTTYDLPMVDDTQSYYLSCVDQRAPFGTLLETSSASACPVASPGFGGSFSDTWDASF